MKTPATRAPLVRLARLLLDDRSERDQFAGRLDRQIDRALRPDFVDRLGLGLGHSRQLGLARVAALEEVSVGKQRSLARRLLDVAEENVVVAKTLDDLIARQALGNGELVLHDLVRDQLGLDLAQADARLERVFPAFERASAAVDQRHRGEPERAVDDAGAFELVADRAAVVLASDDDDLVGLQRSGLARLDHRPGEQRQARQRADQRERQEAAQTGEPGAPRPARRRGRLWLRRPGGPGAGARARRRG